MENFYNARLQKRLEREEDKWQKEAEKTKKEEDKRLYHQKVLIDNKKNSNGYCFLHPALATTPSPTPTKTPTEARHFATMTKANK